jgi:hypothetical protein
MIGEPRVKDNAAGVRTAAPDAFLPADAPLNVPEA